jgi:hypothetical protein
LLTSRRLNSFSLGAIITSILGLIILPRFSCPPIPPGGESTCNVKKDNNGWRIMLFALGVMVRGERQELNA